MKGKIALEEHFAFPDTLQDSAVFAPPRLWPTLERRILDIHGERLEEMDKAGLEMMLLSLNAPAIQAIPDPRQAADVARRSNDYLAREIARNPKRFQGLAALAMQDADSAARELERCVKELGFRGALVNGFSQTADTDALLYYDLPRYRPFWAIVEQLDVPFYLHPRNPLPRDARIYDGHPWLLGPTWGFGQETAVHALRLMCSGIFDAHPGVQIILGHMGEGLPFSIWRCDHRNKWMQEPPKYPARRLLSEYFRENFHITVSGNFSSSALVCSLLELGADRIMFSTDWPFEAIDQATDWFDASPIGDIDRLKIGRTNALRLFKLQDILAD
ncbi:MAG: amidohydrolase family protein [Hyphomicrobiaceae bacterium]